MINYSLLKPDTLAQIVADLETANEMAWAKSRDLGAIDEAKVALAESVGQYDVDLMIERAHNR